MKPLALLSMALLVFSFRVEAQDAGTTVTHHDFETTKGLAVWPANTPLHLDPENPKEGASSIRFTPDTGCSAYWYVKLLPESKYRVKLFYRLDRPTLPRHGILFQFSKQGGATGGLGSTLFAFDKASGVVADGQWHEMAREFVTPPETQSCRLQLAFYRTPATVNVDALRLDLIGPATKEEMATAPAAPAPAKAEESAPAAPSAKLDFANGDFESGAAGWAAWFKTGEAQWKVDEAEKHSGKASVLIESASPGRHFLVRSILGIKPKATYKVAFWVKTQDFNAGEAAVVCDFSPVNAKPRAYCDLSKLRGTQPWQQVEFYAEAPEGAAKAFLCLVQASGKIWFDDITFAEEKE